MRGASPCQHESLGMGEYQYYGFMAIDGPISDEGLRYAQGCSSRANVSRVRWQNTYHFGSFPGSVDTLLKYYDAHFYIDWAWLYQQGSLPRDYSGHTFGEGSDALCPSQ